MRQIRKVLCWLLCAVMLAGAVACSGEKSASGKKVAVPEVQQGKRVVTHEKDREKGVAVGEGATDKVVVENNALAVPVPVPPPVAGSQGTAGSGCYGASVCITTKPNGSVEETPPITDGPSIVEARDEAAKARDPNVAKDLTDAEKAELGGSGSGTPGGWEPGDEEKARNNEAHNAANGKNLNAELTGKKLLMVTPLISMLLRKMNSLIWV
ncbi:hypothetical protein [Cedecea colo]|uniref:hypothetical protein n=1 Tax=Cedecea colo TaxID=2552946 RepID=UPI001F2DE9E3|nr:hypothetical protein [Cedecea colo]